MKSTAVLQGPRDRRLRSLGLQIQATECSMSALPSTAEIYQGDGHVRFVPEPDLCTAANSIAHSITSSARARIVGGIVRPSDLEVFRLMTSWNFVGSSTGRSAGL